MLKLTKFRISYNYVTDEFWLKCNGIKHCTKFKLSGRIKTENYENGIIIVDKTILLKEDLGSLYYYTYNWINLIGDKIDDGIFDETKSHCISFVSTKPLSPDELFFQKPNLF